VNRTVIIVIAVAAATAIAIGSYAAFSGSSSTSAHSLIASSSNVTSNPSTAGVNEKIQVVAAENFWGSLVSQLGGTRIEVLSIVSDPNADPHEYESNNADARAIANAGLVIVNGAGYDDWALKLISAGNNPDQRVLNVAQLLGKKEGDNPHFWYSPAYVNQTVHQMYSNLIAIDPSYTSYYKQQYANLNATLGQYNSKIAEIRHQFAGTRVAATEDIFDYLANATGLDLVSPPEFMQAVAEGNDPPAQSITQFQQVLQNGNVNMLVYNQQTVTPLTENIKSLAAQKNIPVVGISETIQPADLSFQDWMGAELVSIQNALNARPLGH
jgi:zinc/manganese transport system substrate-binding protein